MPLPARSPNLNAYAERWVRSVKQECLSKLILFGERPLRRALQQYVAHYHEERNHQGKQNRLLFPLPNRRASGESGIVRCKERLGGLLRSGELPFLGSEDEFFYHTGNPKRLVEAASLAFSSRSNFLTISDQLSRSLGVVGAVIPPSEASLY